MFEKKEELNAIGLTQEKKLQIYTDTQKKIDDLIRNSIYSGVKDNENIDIATTQARLDVVKKGTSDELQLQIDLINAKRNLSITDEQASTDNENVKAAKVFEINKKAYDDRLKLTQDFYIKQSELQQKASQEALQQKNADLDLVINSNSSSFTDQQDATRQKLQNEVTSLNKQIDILMYLLFIPVTRQVNWKQSLNS